MLSTSRRLHNIVQNKAPLSHFSLVWYHGFCRVSALTGAVETRDQMLSTTFSGPWFFVIDTQRRSAYFVWLMRKSYLSLNLVSLYLRAFSTFLLIVTMRITSMDIPLLFYKKFPHESTIMSADVLAGNLNTPELLIGIETVLIFLSDTSFKTLVTTCKRWFLSFLFSLEYFSPLMQK